MKLLSLILLPVLLVAVAPSLGAPIKVGVAKVNITPDGPLWMSGYGARDRPASGKLTELWAKAVVFEDARGERGVLISLDLVGIDRGICQRVAKQLQDKLGLDRRRVALCSSHTHSGPVVGDNLRAMYFFGDDEQARINKYTTRLEAAIVDVVRESISKLAAARLEHGVGKSTLAVNRRNNPEKKVPELRAAGKLVGPVDHDVPVLVARGADDRVVAVIFAYACHATVLDGYEWCGDWPGYAQIEVEKAYPGAVALFAAGCGADQNPLPRRKVALAEEYGRRIASAVVDVAAAPMSPVGDSLSTQYAEIPLAFARLPSAEELAQAAKGNNKYEASRAKMLLAAHERDGKLPPAYPYPVQTWRFTSAATDATTPLTMVILGGEVVVDYALRIKQEQSVRAAGRIQSTWVIGYANDVMAYIPSRRVLFEGGYEGREAMIYYGLPSAWCDRVEQDVLAEVGRQLSD